MNKKGFTLLEIIIVLIGIILIVTISIPLFSKIRTNTESTKVKIELNNIYTAIISHYAGTGKFPKSWEELEDYINIPNVEAKYELNSNAFK